MEHTDSGPEEALTKVEISGTEPPPPQTGEKRKNAFAELMSPKKPSQPPKPQISRGGNPFKDRMGLGAYLADPAVFPASVVISHDDDFVVIHDKYPKATVHALILPRSSRYQLMHPFEALADLDLLAKVRGQVVRVKALVASELQRRLGSFSAAEAARQAVLNGETEPTDASGLPSGRGWASEVRCGIHAVPSMRHLHIHVFSRDMHSPALRHRKHYNSFNTPFLVDIDDFPLSQDDPRRDTKREGYLAWDLKCWRCGRNYVSKFKELKEHLESEFEAWKRQ